MASSSAVGSASCMTAIAKLRYGSMFRRGCHFVCAGFLMEVVDRNAVGRVVVWHGGAPGWKCSRTGESVPFTALR